MIAAPVDQAAHQPEDNLQGGVGVGRKVQGQRGHGAGKGIDRHTGENKR